MMGAQTLPMIDDERMGRESQSRSRNSAWGRRETSSGSGPSPALPAMNQVTLGISSTPLGVDMPSIFEVE